MDVDLVGRRIRLRPFLSSDAEDVFAYAGDPVVSRYLDWQPHSNLSDSDRFIAASIESPATLFRFAVELLDAGRVIGSFELRVVDTIRRIGEIGFALSPAYWGQGYNLEAGDLLLGFGFEYLGLQRIQGFCDVQNRRSARTMEKLGMVREMVLAKNRWRDGRWIDRYRYGILRREWTARR